MNGPEFLSLRPGTRYKFTQRAGTVIVPGKGEFPERFAPSAFRSVIDTVIPLKPGEPPAAGTPDDRPVLGHARVLAADVAPDGFSVTFTYEITSVTETE